MELTTDYVLSQVFTIIMYVLLIITYYCKSRDKVLLLNMLASLASATAYIFLNAWTGLMTCIISLVRNIIYIIDEKKNGQRETVGKKDIIILVIIGALLIVSAVFTYEGFFSLFSIIATMLYTFSICQKKTVVYRLLGIPAGICWIIYNTYVMSIFGIILESVLLIAAIIGYASAVIEQRKMLTSR